MRRLTIAGSIAGAIAALTLGTVVLVASVLAASAQSRPSYWPSRMSPSGVMCPNTGPCPFVLQEWYSDLPWTQKLGTYRGNEIDEAYMLPYGALPPQNQAYCNNQNPKLTPERCMIETGINSIMGIHRTDTLYYSGDNLIKTATKCVPGFTPGTPCSKTLPYCTDTTFPCIEVQFAVSMFWNRSDDAANKTLTLDPRPIGREPQGCPTVNPPPNCIPNAYYGGFVLTDGQTYGPQMPWFMSHYCDSLFPVGTADVQDPACYADYLSPMNDGFNGTIAAWPNDVAPWSVFPNNGPQNHCAPGTTTTPPLAVCTFALAGFDFEPVSTDLTTLQYPKYNGNLFAWFNNALAQFPINFSAADLARHFPWNGAQLSWPTDVAPQALLNPFQGQFTYKQTAPGVPATGCDVALMDPPLRIPAPSPVRPA
jgi:hypothetical protein